MVGEGAILGERTHEYVCGLSLSYANRQEGEGLDYGC